MSTGLAYRLADGECTLSGVLDELAAPTLSEVSARLGPGTRAVFELGELKRINSLGVRAWVDFMKQLGAREIVFRRCSPAFVDQLNTVSDFRGEGRVESFLAPYVCESSGNVFYEELTVGKDITKEDQSALSGRRCAECPEPLVFDDLPERYLHFLEYV